MCKVEEFYDFKNGLNKEKEFFGSGVPIVNFVDVFHNRGLTPEMLKGRVTLSKKEIKNFEVKQGDIFFTRTSETINEIGYPSVMLGVPTDTVFSGFVLRGRARSVDPMDNLFKRYVFFTESFRNEMVKKSSMTTRALTSGTAIKEMYVQYPSSKDEQHKIGAFLAQIDDTIALHQRKLDQLKELKKAYLQLMFASTNTKNDKLPKLRFTGFKGYWELCKLSDISDKVKEKNKHGKFTETLTNSAEYGIINQRFFFDKDISNANNLDSYYVVQNDDFVYNPRISNFAPVGPIKRNKLGRTGVMSPLYYVFRTHSIDNNYLEKYFDTVYWHHFMELNGDTGARADRFAIKDSIFVEMPIPYPSTEEQKKIGIFFKKLDQSITLYKNKLNQLKTLKKSYLQNMFI
ncbi:restriction endonuclease subunit S [Enterococcus faecalis]|uniref:restriction endonuclease subunit S n=3 Tax=Enterococcus faecalis TaxID=1351 RepID=UPI001D146409|nr:restriction endonuclease subunit S [Enterococcus faecalis]MDK8222712.1 restriction endonuclease subunit S [Enterococcus faecalis]MDK8246987.1 restriction endonuclease subunit S [Enterococcus faecalis]MDN3175661.1 restriction endonuclease subunit S [Enterococcus faecalis]MDT2094601.1 restriction endonuclease subunit S [Enterococcus faecalis]MDV7732826.1 restriction endonuclease subunit S [Enterococcus faecalis]